MPARIPPAPSPPPPGLAARRIAADIVDGVLRQQAAARRAARGAAISARCPSATAPWCAPSSPPCCAGSARLRHLLAALLERGLPRDAPQVEAVAADRRGANPVSRRAGPRRGRSRRCGSSQADRHAAHYAGLVNAVLRRARARRQGACSPRSTRVLLDTPDWLMQRWIAHYGEADRARHRRGARARSRRSTSPSRAIRRAGRETLGGRVLPTGIGAH